MAPHVLCKLTLAAAIVLPCMEASAAACASVSLSVYTGAGFNCTIGDLTFSDFSYGQLGTFVVPALNINVNPINAAKRGLQFFDPVDFTATAGNFYQGTITYTITVNNGGNAINGIELSQAGATVNGPFGAEGVTKNYCATGGTIANCPAPVGGVLPGFSSLAVTPAASTATASFAALTLIGVSDVLFLSAGANSGAHVSFFQNLVTQVPEPSTWLMLTCGLTGLLAQARSRRA